MHLITIPPDTCDTPQPPRIDPTVPLSSTDQRQSAELLLRRAHALPAQDIDILRAIYDRGQRAAQVARLRGERPRQLRRRIRRLVARVLSPEFAFVVDHRHAWSPARRAVANAVFIEGRSVHKAAAIAKLSYHAARRHHFAILTMFSRHEARGEAA